MAPTVSVLITNYNYARFLRQAIDSVLAQTRPVDQIVVVDDGSSDGSLDILEEHYAGVVEVVGKPNGGQGSAFNRGFLACRGDIVCLLDADDYWLPGKVAAVVRGFEECAGTAMVRHDLTFEEPGGPQDGRPVLGLSAGTHAAVPAARGLIERRYGPTSALSFRRQLLDELLPMPEAEFRISADAYLYTLASTVGPVVDLAESLAVYRLHGSNGYANAGERSQRRALGTEVALLRVLQQRGVDPVVPHHLYRSARRLGDDTATQVLLHERSRFRRTRDCARGHGSAVRRMAHALVELTARKPARTI